MPGISLRFVSDIKTTKIKNDQVLKALNSTVYNHNYKQEVLLEDQHYLLASSRYPEYPMKIFEDGNFWVCIEGKIYGKEDSVIKNELEGLLKCVFTNINTSNVTMANGNNDKLVNWLLKTDGEFIIYALNRKTKDFAIINDVLGRLPFYYHYNANLGLIISRELQFVAFLMEGSNGSKFDRMAIAQYLLLGYPLGKRTLLTDVFRVQPASLIRTRNNSKPKEKQFKIDTLYSFNFDNKRYTDQDIKKNAVELVSLFSEACKNRANSNTKDKKKKNIISLSGGLDSRCVTAAFNNKKIPCSAVTYIAPGWTPILGNDSEVEVAKQLANMFGIEWENYGLFEPKSKDLLNLLTIKQGVTYLGYSFILPFLEELKERYDGLDVTFFTGEGRETVLPHYIQKTESRKFRNLDDLIKYIINTKGNFSLGDIAAITQIKESEIVDELKDIMSSYPEKSLNQKYVHFTIYENAFKGIFEIEDKDRYYFWSTSPFYSIPFFGYAMNCKRKALYREFLLQLSPPAAGIDKADYGAAITSYKYRIITIILILTSRYPHLKKIIRKISNSKNSNYDSNLKVLKCLQDQIRNCKLICGYLSCSKIQNILNNSTDYKPRGLNFLFTITSLIERTYCSQSISKYYG